MASAAAAPHHVCVITAVSHLLCTRVVTRCVTSSVNEAPEASTDLLGHCSERVLYGLFRLVHSIWSHFIKSNTESAVPRVCVVTESRGSK